MKNFYVLENNFVKQVETIMVEAQWHMFITSPTISRPRQQVVEELDRDYRRHPIVNFADTAASLYQRYRDHLEKDPNQDFSQGNMQAAELPGNFYAKIGGKNLSIVQQKEQTSVRLRIFYQNDASQACGLSIFFIEKINGQGPYWIISQVTDILKPQAERPHLFICSQELSQMVSKETIKDISLTSQPTPFSTAALASKLYSHLNSEQLQKLIAPIFSSSTPKAEIAKLNQRLGIGPENLDHRDEKKAAILALFSAENHPLEAEYLRLFQTNIDFFKHEDYLMNLHVLFQQLRSLSPTSMFPALLPYLRQAVELTYPPLQIPNGASNFLESLSMKESTATLNERYKSMLKTSLFEPNISEFLAAQEQLIEQFNSILPQFSGQTLPIDFNHLAQEVYDEIRSTVVTNIEEFRRTLAHPLDADDPDYWNQRQAFIAEKEQAFKQLQTMHEQLQCLQTKCGALGSNADIATLLEQIQTSINQLKSCQDLKKADVIAISGENAAQMRLRFDSEPNFFEYGTYCMTLSELPDNARALARAKDIQVRSQLFTQPVDFLSLYWRSSNDRDYLEKIRQFLAQKEAEFNTTLVKFSPKRIKEDTIDIAETQWDFHLENLRNKESNLKSLKCNFATYKDITKAYLENPLVVHQMIQETEARLSSEFFEYKNTQLMAQSGYHFYIQKQGFEQGMKTQIACWYNHMKQLEDFNDLRSFQQQINQIFRQLTDANRALFQSDDTAEINQEFAALKTELSAKIELYRPPSFLQQLSKRWAAFPYRQEALMIASSIVTAAICNPLVVGVSLALAVAAIALSLITFAIMRMMPHSPTLPPAPAPQ